MITILKEQQTEAGYLLAFSFLLPGQKDKVYLDEDTYKNEAIANRYLLDSTKDVILIWLERYCQLYSDFALSPKQEIAQQKLFKAMEKLNPLSFDHLQQAWEPISKNANEMLPAFVSSSKEQRSAQLLLNSLEKLINGPDPKGCSD